MAEDRKQAGVVNHRSGGVNIAGQARVDVRGDLVGRDKIEGGQREAETEALFTRLGNAIRGAPDLATKEKDRLAGAGDELKAELGHEHPDLGKVDRLKALLVSRSGQVAAATSAIFAYGPVQDTLKLAMQRLLGSVP